MGKKRFPYRLLNHVIGTWVAFGFGLTAQADVLFVKSTPTGSADCRSWANACSLTTARGMSASGDEIWVKAGVYGPIVLNDGIRIIGGFAGNETSASQSNPILNITALDGGGAVRVVGGHNNPPSTVLRGFHIRNGVATDSNGGGGMLLNGSSPKVMECVFENNQANLGGAVHIHSFRSSWPRPQFVNCVFRNNGRGESFDDALPLSGGAVFAKDGLVTFVNCLFHHNKAGDGGAVTIGGSAVGTFVNCTFTNNTAYRLGGAVESHGPGSDSVSLFNCILWGNVAVENYNQIYGDVAARNCCIQGEAFGNNIDADPLFRAPEAHDYGLQAGSPCIDSASHFFLPADFADLDWDGDVDEPLPLDLALRPRLLGANVDMGAYEAPSCGDGNCDAGEGPCNCLVDCGAAAESEQVGATCKDGQDNDCDEAMDCDDSDCGPDAVCLPVIPTVSTWGMLILTLLLLTVAKIYFGTGWHGQAQPSRGFPRMP